MKRMIIAVALLLSSCAVSERLDDGYNVGDITAGVIESYDIYCSLPLRGIRSLGRFTLVMLGGVVIPDLCTLETTPSQPQEALTESAPAE